MAILCGKWYRKTADRARPYIRTGTIRNIAATIGYARLAATSHESFKPEHHQALDGSVALADELQNAYQAWQVMGVSRDTFYQAMEA